MPVPFLFIGVGALTAAAGAGTTAKAVKDNSKAKRINDKANEKIMFGKSWDIFRDHLRAWKFD